MDKRPCLLVLPNWWGKRIKDTEVQTWWKEVVEKGHGDLKDKQWWRSMQTLQDLIQSWSIIIWTTPALHAAVNFGQYP